MKARLNLTIEDSLLNTMKAYAEKQHMSVSELVESYFKAVTTPPRRKNILHLVEKLGQHNIDPNADLKEDFYKDQATKYGF